MQAKRASTISAWKDRVKNASYPALPEGHYCCEGGVSVTLFYFPGAAMQGDIDNIVKPVLDALCKHIYYDDRQVERVWVQKFEPGRPIPFVTPSDALAGAIQGRRPALYVRLSDDPTEGLS